MSNVNDIVAKYSAARIETLEAELKLVYENLTATQTRCNELLEENREHKRHIQAIRIAWANLIGSDGKMP